MERKLQQLFDLQHFAGNQKLQALIDDTMSRCSTSRRRELFDDELQLSAAGTPEMINILGISNSEDGL